MFRSYPPFSWASILGYASWLIGKKFWGGVGYPLNLSKGPLYLFNNNYSTSAIVPFEILLSSNPTYLICEFLAIPSIIFRAPIYPISFHLKSNTFKLGIFNINNSLIYSDKKCEIRLFFKSIISNWGLLLANFDNAIIPAGEDPIKFHYAIIIFKLGQCCKAEQITYKD